jgi:hypothetical protein
MSDPKARLARLRHTAVGALAALAIVGAIAGIAAEAKTPGKRAHASASSGAAAKTPPAEGKAHAAQPGADQPFLGDARQLVGDGAITPAEGQVLEGEIESGTVDSGALAAAGFTATQVQAVEAALSTSKEALAPRPEHPSK